jgi:single-stranded DNA-binding protein
MLSALASGQLIRAPKHGTSASGTRWANATMRCSTGTDREGAALTSFVQVVCFGDVADTLAKMTQGDAISVQGPMKQTEYTRDDGEVRHGLEIVANGILTTYQVRQRRGDENASGKPSGKKQWTGSREDRAQADAYRDFARQAAGPAHDNSFDSEVPF